MHEPDILITGAQGMLGRYLCAQFGERALGLGKTDLDVRDERAVDRILGARPIRAMIQCVGTRGVDDAEPISSEAQLTTGMARICADRGVGFAFLSSARVFSGEANRPYVEQDEPAPIDAYGEMKLKAEEALAGELAKGIWWVIRLPMVLGLRPVRPNAQIVIRLLERLRKGEAVSASIDVIHSALHASEAARVIGDLVERKSPSGVYHVGGARTESLYRIVERCAKALAPGSCVKPVEGGVIAEGKPFPKMQVLASAKLPARGVTVDAVDAFIAEMNGKPWSRAAGAEGNEDFPEHFLRLDNSTHCLHPPAAFDR